jgi:hypothetical protein
MALVDPQFEQHRETWLGFVRLMRYGLVAVIIILVGLAIFVA